MQSLGLGARVFGFLLVGALSLIYLFTQLGEADFGHSSGYTIHAAFSNAGGLRPGSPVELAGVRIGHVTAIRLNGTRAEVSLKLHDGIPVQDDAIASILTKGLLGERYVIISPGGSDELVKPGGKLRETESPLDLPGLLSAYVNFRQRQSEQQAPATDKKSSGTKKK
ncbi:MAG: outer membrane lipid asymmetry maintenance protein MlaD [Deltaproteobacteria bacterium]|nr:outer membrane lipid asymmetry maintenance protein MlaD [Deltaproteobacteria bacterium]